MDFFTTMPLSWRDALDIALVALLFYRLILMVKGTRAVSAIYGLLLLGAIYAFSHAFGLYSLGWLLENLFGSLFLVIVIVFQRDIRQALTDMGAHSFWRRRQSDTTYVDEVIAAALYLAQRRIGALIVIERNVALGDVLARGVAINGQISRELLITIFFPNTPLHDGAVILRNGEIAAAACILPLASVTERKEFGTRHRAALGITEESDAVAIVVSEERAAITIAVDGTLTTSLDAAHLKKMLHEMLEK